MNVTWVDHADEFAAELAERIETGLYVTGEHLVSLCIEATSTPGRQPPGHAPGVQTGRGQRSICMTREGGKVQVGSTAENRGFPYMSRHDSGIHYRKAGFIAHPWLMQTMRKNYKALGQDFLSAGRE